MQREEEVLGILVETILPGSRMEYSAHQSYGECDFQLHIAEGTYPFEATRHTNRRRQAMNAAIMGRDGSDEFVDRHLAQNDWWVFPSQIANIRRVRAHADRLLAAIEQEGRTQFDVALDYQESPAVRAIWNEVRIIHGTQLPWSPPGRIGIGTPGDSATLHGDQVVAAVEAEARKEDNRRKLGTTTAQRHLGVYIDYLGYPAHASMLAGFLPSQAPKLPDEVTHVWVVCDHGEGPEYLVWAYDRVRGWVDYGKFRITGPAA